MGYVLGIDGGSLRTFCVIADAEGHLLGLGKAGGSNLSSHDPDEARSNLQAAIKQARAAAGVKATSFDAACLGTSGFSALGTHELAEEMLAGVVKAKHLLVEQDSVTTLFGATAGGPGVVVLAGTGSVAYGINSEGKQHRAGGWGYVLSDEGSMYWIGLSSLRVLVRSYDGVMPRTVLTPEIFTHLGITRMSDLLDLVYHQGISRSDILSIAPITIRAAQEGDEAAADVVNRAADCLASIARAVVRKLGLKEESFPLAISGNVFESGPVLMEPFAAKIAQFAPNAQIGRPKFDPVIGATLLALRAVGVKPTEEAIAEEWNQLRSTSAK